MNINIVHPHDERLKFLTGFNGYFGDALVTKNKTVFWTDSRYSEQAKSELSSEWDIIITSSDSKSATLAQWLINEFKGHTKAYIGADPMLVPAFVWLAWEKELEKSNIKLVKVGTYFNLNGWKNLIDSIWKTDRPNPNTENALYNPKYFGKDWKAKIADVRNLMKSSNVDAVVLTDMSEITWLLNIRGYDLSYYLGLFKAYLVIEKRKIKLFVDKERISYGLKQKWRINDKNCVIRQGLYCVEHFEYHEIFIQLRTYSQLWELVWLPSRCGFTPGISMYIYDSIPAKKRIIQPSPVITLRTTKNQQEIEGIRHAHQTDGSATTQFLSYFDNVYTYRHINRNILDSLKEFRGHFYEQNEPEGIPFPIFIGYANNPKTPCYNESCLQTKVNEDIPVVNLRYSVNYRGGTVNSARTIHFSEEPPAPFKKAYTDTLINLIDVAKTTFPTDITIDELQRGSQKSFVNVEYDDLFNSVHGFGHLVAFNSSLIPSPSIQYSPESCSRCNIRRLKPGQFIVNGHSTFVNNGTNSYWNSNGQQLLGFEDISRVPYDVNLIDEKLLNQEHFDWLKKHGEKIRKDVLKQMDVRYWPLRATDFPEIYLLERTRSLK
ncbi:hypothetical protein TSAR_003114 [Trichomalopsis sarcophagae]|uniref:Creatinase N-terminal domain-containing protein n=1 Tax=Trichomalopsis sarcophagae TaxID=543379 RepID=A0A232FMS9_9HYME|nr:hypothetical protein TSAR_003114 [Trichomalopsis sarcophagae]